MPKVRAEMPENLKAYDFHGLELSVADQEAAGDCPFCGREGKFSVNVATSQFKCWVCRTSGNSMVFIRQLWKLFTKSPQDYAELMRDRGLASGGTLESWGVCRSTLTGEWVVPAYNLDGEICQLSRYVRTRDGMRLYATPGFKHGLYGMGCFDRGVTAVDLCEGPWDGMAWWEALGRVKTADQGGLSSTSSEAASLRGSRGVLAVPSCTVFHEAWSTLFADRHLTFMFDNDYPRLKCLKCSRSKVMSESSKCECGASECEEQPPAALDGVRRNSRIVKGSDSPPVEVRYLRWGADGYDLSMPSGTDVRDRLRDLDLKQMPARVGEILSKVTRVPDEWHSDVVSGESDGIDRLQIAPCSTYREVEVSWRKAMQWTGGLDAALSVLLASAMSTNLVGEQLWVKIIGPPSCGKTTVLEGLATCVEHVLSKDTITGLYSGWKSDDGEDHSVASQARGKMLAIKDGDTLLKAPNLLQILSQFRGLYDRVGRTHYKNQVEHDYQGHRMSVAICGTAALREIDASELGARFFDVVVMDDIDADFEDDVGWRAVNAEMRAMLVETTGDSSTQYPPNLARAMSLTGGYVKHLVDNASALVSQVEASETALRRCAGLGKFTAHMRARPAKDGDEATREFSARLSKVFTRLAVSLAVIRNKTEVDDEILAMVAKVAIDTGRGLTFNVSRLLFGTPDGLETKTIALHLDSKEERVRVMLPFMRKLGIVEKFKLPEGSSQTPRWRLTGTMRRMYHLAVGEH